MGSTEVSDLDVRPLLVGGGFVTANTLWVLGWFFRRDQQIDARRHDGNEHNGDRIARRGA